MTTRMKAGKATPVLSPRYHITVKGIRFMDIPLPMKNSQHVFMSIMKVIQF